jgi:hypothetical protein
VDARRMSGRKYAGIRGQAGIKIVAREKNLLKIAFLKL